MHSTFRNLLLFGAAAALTFGAVVLVDRLYGKHLTSTAQSLLYPAFSKARMQTSEFDLTYEINNLGFRGPHVEIEKSDKPRVAFIGDSFTFGWGVEEEESWIGLLRESHPDLELINLGKGGAHPMDHAQLTRKVLPILKPDHLFVCLTSWNDLIQMQRILQVESGININAIPNFQTTPSIISTFIERWLPSLSRKFRAPANINLRWKMEADWMTTTFQNELESLTLSDQVWADFQSGMLNPSGIYDRIISPNSEERLCNSDSLVFWRTAQHLKEVEKTCGEFGVGLTFLILPNRPTNCPECILDLNDLGAELEEKEPCLIDRIPELKLVEIGFNAPLTVFPYSEYRHLHRWYYPLDGHLTVEGNRSVSEWLTPILENETELYK